jgi:hypothetical protein
MKGSSTLTLKESTLLMRNFTLVRMDSFELQKRGLKKVLKTSLKMKAKFKNEEIIVFFSCNDFTKSKFLCIQSHY